MCPRIRLGWCQEELGSDEANPEEWRRTVGGVVEESFPGLLLRKESLICMFHLFKLLF